MAAYAWHDGAYNGEPGQEWPAWDAAAQVLPRPTWDVSQILHPLLLQCLLSGMRWQPCCAELLADSHFQRVIVLHVSGSVAWQLEKRCFTASYWHMI